MRERDRPAYPVPRKVAWSSPSKVVGDEQAAPMTGLTKYEHTVIEMAKAMVIGQDADLLWCDRCDAYARCCSCDTRAVVLLAGDADCIATTIWDELETEPK